MKVNLGSKGRLGSKGGVLLVLPLSLFIFVAATPQNSSQKITVNILENGFSYQLTSQRNITVAELLESMGKERKFLVYPEPSNLLASSTTIILEDQPIKARFQLSKPSLSNTPTNPPTNAPIFTGLATWYYVDTGLTAASREFRRGTVLLVTNAANNKSVEVRINDYGPKAYTGVSLDLSHQAFAQIAPLSQGKIRVRYQVLS